MGRDGYGGVGGVGLEGFEGRGVMAGRERMRIFGGCINSKDSKGGNSE